MLQNYLKIGFRNLLRQKGYSFINISGLAVGIACCLLIFLYIKDEVTYDQYHEKSHRIYRINSAIDFSGSHMAFGATNFAEAMAYTEEIPEVEAFVRLESDAGIVRQGAAYIQQQFMVYGDPALFDMFDFELLAGDFNQVLEGLNEMVITREIALKYFGRTDVVGESLTMNVNRSFENFVVKAVIEDHPSNSSLNFKIVLPWKLRDTQIDDRRRNSWSSVSINSMLLLSEGADVAAVEAKMKDIRFRRNPEEDGFPRKITNSLQPLSSIHLDTSMDGASDGTAESREAKYAYILSGIAMIILIIACINFTNLSVARSFPRAREIGVRKVLGARKQQIAFQFLSEAFLMCIIAFVLGLLLSELALPLFESFTQKKFTYTIVDDPVLMVAAFSLIMLIALFSGFYPSFVLSRFNVVSSLKGRLRLNSRNMVSKALIITQFSVAAVLMIGTIAMNRQINYMINADLGYDDANLVKISTRGAGRANLVNLFRADLAGNTGILGVAGSNNYDSKVGASDGDVEFISIYNTMDDQYLDLIGVELLEGRVLKKGTDRYIRPNDTGGTDTLWNVLVNETFVEQMAWDDPIHKVSDNQYRVVGVVRDFNYASVKTEIEPVLWTSANEREAQFLDAIYVRFSPELLPQIKTLLANTWTKYVPDRPLNLVYLEEQNISSYAEENRWKQVITAASVLAIVISCLGLFGLAHLTTQQRTKEVGIRKVLGARVSAIILLLNSNFANLVLISVLVASPLAYYLLKEWLSGFARQMDISVVIFLFPGLIIFSIAFITVSIQSLSTAQANPIDALRHE